MNVRRIRGSRRILTWSDVAIKDRWKVDFKGSFLLGMIRSFRLFRVYLCRSSDKGRRSRIRGAEWVSGWRRGKL